MFSNDGQNSAINCFYIFKDFDALCTASQILNN